MRYLKAVLKELLAFFWMHERHTVDSFAQDMHNPFPQTGQMTTAGRSG